MPNFVGYVVCFTGRGVILYKTRDVDGIDDTGSEVNPGGRENGGVDGKKGYLYSSSRNLIHILCFVSS
jgi:hypothetical protein